MTGESQVSGSSINANYPMPGQNNSSQGFRDNFQAIKVALTRTSVELTELRQNAVLKNPIQGVPATSNDYLFGKLYRPQLGSYTETFFDLGTQAGTVYIDFFKGNFQKLKTFRDIGLTFRNFPAGSQVGSVKLWLQIENPLLVLTFPDNTVYGVDASFISEKKIIFPRRGQYLVTISSVESGKKFFVHTITGLTDYNDIPETQSTGSSGSSSGSSSSSSGSGSGTESSTTNTNISIVENLDITRLPIASVSDYGLVKIDGTTIGIYDGVISVIGGIPINVSDRNLKSNISPIVDSLSINRQLNGVHFQFIENNKPSIGLIAQDVERVLPMAVEKLPSGYLGVNYGSLIGLLVECVKELETQVKDLQNEISTIKRTSL